MLPTEALTFDRVLRKRAKSTRNYLYNRAYNIFEVGQDNLDRGDLADAEELNRRRMLRYARLEQVFEERTTSLDYIRRLTGQEVSVFESHPSERPATEWLRGDLCVQVAQPTHPAGHFLVEELAHQIQEPLQTRT